VLQESIA